MLPRWNLRGIQTSCSLLPRWCQLHQHQGIILLHMSEWVFWKWGHMPWWGSAEVQNPIIKQSPLNSLNCFCLIHLLNADVINISQSERLGPSYAISCSLNMQIYSFGKFSFVALYFFQSFTWLWEKNQYQKRCSF